MADGVAQRPASEPTSPDPQHSALSPQSPFWNVPNILTLSRLPLAAALFICISYEAWFAALVVFGIAALTDWIDGWWARRFNQQSTFGRVFDPLTDKILLGGAFIFLVPVRESEMKAWMATVVICRELLITGVRGYVESLGKKFGADWFGKLKTVLQCISLAVILGVLSVRGQSWAESHLDLLKALQFALLYAMLAATVGSGVQYCWRAVWLLREVK
jgi:CDP-diacylglycerol---glycerol-3-phosphate 3-phosphatidyltransferase